MLKMMCVACSAVCVCVGWRSDCIFCMGTNSLDPMGGILYVRLVLAGQEQLKHNNNIGTD